MLTQAANRNNPLTDNLIRRRRLSLTCCPTCMPRQTQVRLHYLACLTRAPPLMWSIIKYYLKDSVTHLFQWQCIFRDINRLWFAARFSTWTVVLPLIHGTTTATHRKTRFQGTRLRRRFTDIRSRTFDICICTGCTFFRLRRCSEELDGIESIASESIENCR